jgi:signal peptidase I
MQSAAPSFSSSIVRPAGLVQRAAGRFFWAALVPAVIALLALLYVLPSRLEGHPGGLIAFVGRLVDQDPLVLFVVAFIAAGETIQYWRRVAAPIAFLPAAARSGRSRTKQLAAVLLAAAVALALRTWVVQTYRVEGASMLPTLQLGDRLVVDKLAYRGGRLPKRGDIVVLRANALGDATDDRLLVKRVLGLPGDHVSFAQGYPIINGWAIPTCDGGPYANVAGPLIVTGRIGVEFLDDRAYLTTWTVGQAPSPEFTVPAGQVYVVGDYRAGSKDSRFANDKRGAGVALDKRGAGVALDKRGAGVALDKRGAGVALDKIDGRVSRVLFGGGRDGRLNFSRLLSPLDLHVHQPGVDTRDTESRIAGCVMARPADTSPPAPPVESR